MKYHEPVMLSECIEGLNIKPDSVIVDLTFGGGGHSREILKYLTTGKLIAFDQDEDAKANVIDDKRFVFVQHNFRFLSHFLKYHGIEKVDGILADLGISSHHIDSPERGFSFRFDGDLDMRMNQSAPLTASQIINTYSEESLCKLFNDYGEIKNARKLASVIVQNRKSQPIESTQQLAQCTRFLVPKAIENKYLAQMFQALRIEVNNELESLKEVLFQTAEVLNPSGRLVIMTYHSLEDRLVKNFIKSGNFDGKLEKDFYGNIQTPWKSINKGVTVPCDDELTSNNRSRSAKLRIAELLDK